MLHILKLVPLFQQLDDAQLEQILKLCTKRAFAAKTVLFKENDPGNAFYVILTGSVKVYQSNQKGEEKILSIFNSGDSFGEFSLIDGKPRSATAETVNDSVLLVLSDAQFHDLLRSNYDIALQIMRELCERLRASNQHVYDLTFVDARTRVIKQLILTANRSGRREGLMIRMPMDFEPDEVARMAGVNMQEFNQVMNDLQSKKILHVLPSEWLLDLSKLRS